MGFQNKCLSLLLLVFLPGASFSQEVAGVNISEELKLDNTALNLNGAGVRTRFFFDVFVGALYLPQKTNDVEQVLSMAGPKRMLMHFLFNEVKKEKLIDGWNKGFENNNTSEQFRIIKPKLEIFNSFFDNVKRGDRIEMDYLPGTGTQVSINSQVKGSIPGESFYNALLRVWIGKNPADSDLKKAVLGMN